MSYSQFKISGEDEAAYDLFVDVGRQLHQAKRKPSSSNIKWALRKTAIANGADDIPPEWEMLPARHRWADRLKTFLAHLEQYKMLASRLVKAGDSVDVELLRQSTADLNAFVAFAIRKLLEDAKSGELPLNSAISGIAKLQPACRLLHDRFDTTVINAANLV